MRVHSSLVAAALGMAALSGVGILTSNNPAQAVPIVFQDNFEQYTAGSYVASQTPPIGAPYSSDSQGWIADDATGWWTPAPAANGGSQYFVPGSRTIGNLKSSDATATNGKIVSFNFDFYLRDDTANDGFEVQSAMSNGSGGFGPRAFDIQFKGHGQINTTPGTIAYYDGSNYVSVSDQDFNFPVYQWAHAEIVADYALHQATLTVGSQSVAIPFAESSSNQVDLWTLSDLAANADFIDNFTVAIPEPASLSLLGVGGFLLLRRRKQRA